MHDDALGDVDLEALVRYHGTYDVIDAMLRVTAEVYPDRGRAVEALHGWVVTRGIRFVLQGATSDA